MQSNSKDFWVGYPDKDESFKITDSNDILHIKNMVLSIESVNPIVNNYISIITK